MEPLISIIIRAKNEAKKIKDCLEAIKNQSYNNYEVIVVDSGSTDRTIKIAKKFGCQILKIPANSFTFGYALNIGIKTARGDIVISISAHALPSNNFWLETLINKFNKEKNIAGIYGRQIPFKNANPIEKRGLIEAFPVGNGPEIPSNPHFSNANSAVKKNIFRKFVFNEKLEGAEDIEWSSRVRKAGFVIMYEPKAIVFHSHNESMKQVYKRFYRESKSLWSIKSNFIKKHTLFGYFLRYIRSVFFDYIFIFKNFTSSKWFIKWFFLILPYRIAIYYGQYRGIQEAKK